MKKYNLSNLIICLLVVIATNNAFAQNNIIERLGIPGPLKFDGTNYYLLRATKQNEVTYYQEYVPDNETSDNYNQMLICKLFVTDWSVEDVAKHKMSQITQLKKTDTISTARIFKSPDGNEFIVDYFLGEYTKENKLSGVEYYIYRYKRIKLENDSDAVFAFVYTRHSNGNNLQHFLTEVNSQKRDYVNKMSSAEIPIIKLQPPTAFYLKDPSTINGYSSEYTESQQKAKSYFLSGTTLNANHQYEQAIEKFKLAIEIDSTGNCGTGMNGSAYGELGDCYFKTGDYSSAIKYFDKGIQINKYYPLSYLHKVNLLLMEHKNDDAIKTLDILISNNPNEPFAYAQRGLLYYSTKEDMALVDFKICLKLIKEQNQEEALKEMVKVIQEKCSEIEKKLNK